MTSYPFHFHKDDLLKALVFEFSLWASERARKRRSGSRIAQACLSRDFATRVPILKHESLLKEGSWEIFNGDRNTSNHFIEKCEAKEAMK